MSIGCDDWSFSFKKECDKVAYQCIFCLQSKLKLVQVERNIKFKKRKRFFICQYPLQDDNCQIYMVLMADTAYNYPRQPMSASCRAMFRLAFLCIGNAETVFIAIFNV